jgi:hypothetical protein
VSVVPRVIRPATASPVRHTVGGLFAFLIRPWRSTGLAVRGELAAGERADFSGHTGIELAGVATYDSHASRKVEIERLLSQTATPETTARLLRGIASLSCGPPTTIF